METAEALDVDLIDLRSVLSDRSEFFADVLHMNEAGNRERARLIAQILVERGIAPR